MRVWIVSSYGTACGIADYAQALEAELTAAGIRSAVDPAWLDPATLFQRQAWGALEPPDLVWLNHHDGLHSRWTADHVRQLQALGIRVVVTYHDTRAGEAESRNSDKARQLCAQANAFVVHEPVADLPAAIYWRQGIPAPARMPADYRFDSWVDGTGHYQRPGWKACPQQPVLGTVGFHFPWKNYDRLAEETAALGWALVLCCANATPDDAARWRQRNPSTLVVPGFLPQPTVINYLAGCDATAFLYECQNNGTSGAIRQGIAARKPVLAFEHCRQFRDLLDPDLDTGIRWCETWDDVREALRRSIHPVPWDPRVTALAHLDSWTGLGRRYADLFRAVTGGRPGTPPAAA